MKYKAPTLALFLFLSTISIFLIYSDPHPRGFNASNISPERVKELLKSNPPETVSQLFTIVDGLHRFSIDNKRYPSSIQDPYNGFILTSYKNSTDKLNWIPGLVPAYLPSLPMSDIPNMPSEAMFVYRSNGGYFMLLARSSNDCLWVKHNFKELVYDSEGECLGFGIWTKNAMLWRED